MKKPILVITIFTANIFSCNYVAAMTGRGDTKAVASSAIETKERLALQVGLAESKPQPASIASQHRMLTDLIKAVQEDEKETAIKLIKASDKATVNVQGPHGKTALMWAVSNSNSDLVVLLLEHGADVNIADDDRFTPLMEAIEKDASEIAILLIQKGADVNLQDVHGFTALMRAMLKKNEAVLKALIQADADPFKRNKQNQLLFDMIKDDEGVTIPCKPHHIKCPTKISMFKLLNNKDIASLLTNHCEAWEEFSHRVYMSIYATDDLDELCDLLQSKKNINFKNQEGETALIIACRIGGDSGIAQKLIKMGVDLNMQSENGKSALMWACALGYIDIVDDLLRSQACVINLQDSEGKTALMLASEESHERVVQALLKAQARCNSQNKKGETALMLACKKGHLKVVRLLLEEGADTALVTKKGETVYSIAVGKGFKDIEAALEEYAKKQQEKSTMGLI